MIEFVLAIGFSIVILVLFTGFSVLENKFDLIIDELENICDMK